MDVLTLGGFTLFLATFAALRLLPVALHPGYRPGDVRAHMSFCAHERERPNALWKEQLNYPILFHWLVARLRLSTKALHLFLPLLLDTIVLLLLLWLLRRGIAEGWATERGAMVGLLAYAFLPANMMSGVGPRSYGFNERIFSEVLVALLAVLGIWLQGWWVWPLLVALALAALLSSRFATQVLLLVILPAAVIAGNARIASAILAALLVACLVPVFRYCDRLRRHYAHVVRYLECANDPAYWIGRRNRPPRWRHDRPFMENLGQWAKFLLRTNGISAGLVWFFPIHVGFLVAISAGGELAAREWQLLVLVAVSVLWWIMTSFGRLKVLGESERYLHYAAAPASLLLAHVASDWTDEALAGFLVSLFLLAAAGWIQAVVSIRKASREHARMERALLPVIHFLEREMPEATVGSILPTQPSWILLERLGARCMWYDLFLRQDWRRCMFRYPFPSPSYIREWNPDVIVTESGLLSALCRENSGYAELERGYVRRVVFGKLVIYVRKQ